MKYLLICISVIVLFAGCSKTVTGTVVRFSNDLPSYKEEAPSVTLEGWVGPRLYPFAETLTFSINDTPLREADAVKALNYINPLPVYSIYATAPFYPPRATLELDKNRNVKSLYLYYHTLAGFIKEHDASRNLLTVSSEPVVEYITTNSIHSEMDFYIGDIPEGDIRQRFENKALSFKLTGKTRLFYNFTPINRRIFERLTELNRGAKIHIVTDEKFDKIISLNIIIIQRKLEISTPERIGVIRYYDKNIRRLKVFTPIRPLFFENNEVYRVFHISTMRGAEYAQNLALEKIRESIAEAKWSEHFRRLADYFIADNAKLIIGGKDIDIDQYFSDPVTVGNSLFNGPAYLNFNERGEILHIIIPYEYAQSTVLPSRYDFLKN
jgi:hypothetical protein